MAAVNELDVFVNCPFDSSYKPIFNAIVFTVVRSGYQARCGLEAANAADNRLEKICSIIAECKFGIHDISRTETDGDPPLPRFNMPLELGLFLGARRYGGRAHRTKMCIVFDREPHRYQKFISDIAGQDINSHGGDVRTLIRELADWLRQQPGGVMPGGGASIAEEYAEFERRLPGACASLKMTVDELKFNDFVALVTAFVAGL